MATISLSSANHKIGGEVTLPGSKSYTNRALIVAAIANGKTKLINASLSDDSIALIEALRKLGVEVDVGQESITVQGLGGKFRKFTGEINVGHAGTTMRFLAALLAVSDGLEVVLSGSDRMHERPIKDLVECLRSAGASIDYLKKIGCPPLRIKGSSRIRGELEISGETSSQFVSALLLVSPMFHNGLNLNISGNLVSESYVVLTIDTMKSFGVSVTADGTNRYNVAPGSSYHPVLYPIEADLSGASYFFGLAAVSGQSIKVANVNPCSKQGDLGFVELLSEMGCKVTKGPTWIELSRNTPLRGIVADMSNMPDVAQTLAVVASVAEGKTVITGLGTLRHKETDRIHALHTELSRLGINAVQEEGSLTVMGGKHKAAKIKTYDDHRMAMAFSILGAVVPGIEIEDPQVVSKSFPGYWEQLSSLGVNVSEVR